MGNQITYFGFTPADIQVSMFEYQATAGNIWAVNTGLQTIATPIYYALAFTTPAKGFTALASWEVDKSGDELLVQLCAGITVFTGATAITNTRNLSSIETKSCPFTGIAGGVSPTVTLTASIVQGDTLLGGTGAGIHNVSGATENGRILMLAPNTQYAMKVTALGTSTKFIAKLFLANIMKTV